MHFQSPVLAYMRRNRSSQLLQMQPWCRFRSCLLILVPLKFQSSWWIAAGLSLLTDLGSRKGSLSSTSCLVLQSWCLLLSHMHRYRFQFLIHTVKIPWLLRLLQLPSGISIQTKGLRWYLVQRKLPEIIMVPSNFRSLSADLQNNYIKMLQEFLRKSPINSLSSILWSMPVLLRSTKFHPFRDTLEYWSQVRLHRSDKMP